MKTRATEIMVWVLAQAWEQMAHWIEMAGGLEVSGLGLVDEERDKDGRLVGYCVTEVFLPKQSNGPTSTELDSDAVAQLMLELERRKDGTGDRLRFWWHYHPGNIGLVWSQTDDECVDDLHNGGWFLASVFNPDLRCRTRLDLYEPVRLTIDDIRTRIRYGDRDLREHCEQLYRERVTRRALPGDLWKGRGPSRLAKPGAHSERFQPRTTEIEELVLAREEMESGLIGYDEYLDIVEGAGLGGDLFDSYEEGRCATGDNRTSWTALGSARRR